MPSGLMVLITAPAHPDRKARSICSEDAVGGPEESRNGFFSMNGPSGVSGDGMTLIRYYGGADASLSFGPLVLHREEIVNRIGGRTVSGGVECMACIQYHPH
jgi:hypothetical protein